MKNYKIIIQYDGTRYKGWQGQKSTDATIQGKLEHVLSNMAGHVVEVIGSGRTDAGVHAAGQVANFKLEEHWSKEEIFATLNQYLPEDIAVISIEEVDERFHSRYQAIEKTYVYRIHNSKIPDVFGRRFSYQYEEKLDIDRMKKAAALLTGTHDFASFCGNKKMKKSTVRTIYQIQVEKEKDDIVIAYTGNGFLQNMIRILTGTLIEIGSKRREVEEIPKILDGKNRELAGYTAPPQGLLLKEVRYENGD